MLTPDYLLHISEGAEEIAEQLHNDIVTRIVERVMYRIGRGDEYLLTAQDKWQIQTLQEAGFLLEDIQKDITLATKRQMTEIQEAMEDAGVKALEYDDKIYRDAGLSPIPLIQSPGLIRLMQRNYEATLGEWKNFTRTTVDAAQQAFVNAVDHAYMMVASGAVSYTQAVKEAVDNMVSNGIEIIYPTGHKDTLETATLRAVRTGIAQATGQIQIARMDEMGIDLVITTSHLGARPDHHIWQGKVFSRSGKGRYPDFVLTTGYGTVTGLKGANCRHDFSPYFEGMDNPFEQYDSEENKKAYEQQQRQRTLERRIRKTKREVMGYKSAIDSCKDDRACFELDLEYQKKSRLLQKQNAAYNTFCVENGLKRLSDRISIAKWDRRQAAAAREAARRYESNILSDDTSKWAKELKKELLQDEKVLSVRKKETAVIYGSSGKFMFQKRGSENEIRFTKSEIKRMEGGVITHNHPSGGSFSVQDIYFFRMSKVSEIRVTAEQGVYFLKQPKIWPEEINSLEKIKKERKEIAIVVSKKYNEMYKQGKITKAERFQMTSEEINQIFAERFGLEYGKESFND